VSVEKLYHKEIGFPAGFRAPRDLVMVAYSGHALNSAKDDRYGEMFLPDRMRLSDFEVIEIGIIGRRVSKILFRGELDDDRDLCIVLIPNGRSPWRCKTVWINERSDAHKTLNASKYETP
jgi:hypothetical protein